MATIRKRTTTRPDGAKIVRFVIDTRPTRPQGEPPANVEASRDRTTKTDHDQPATEPMKEKAKSKVGTYTALVIIEPANPYLTRSREKAFEIAKRAGILNNAGELIPPFR
ncbi:hypothetical protein [Achromobacter denitrificans]|uniref:hypothetical protein n=1 Tax=Achromobacter denitrificans TaxID=32002 RepID=UPI00112504C8|nr:hypothetical protein [Achromobacter denitrificans]